MWIDPVHDRAGNMTTLPKPSSPANGLTCQWDAWNRLVEVKGGVTVVARYKTGRTFDPETELHYYRHRIYHAGLGRFLTRDPVGYEGGVLLFGFLRGSPLDLVDPTGLIAQGPPRPPRRFRITGREWTSDRVYLIDYFVEFGYDCTPGGRFVNYGITGAGHDIVSRPNENLLIFVGWRHGMEALSTTATTDITCDDGCPGQVATIEIDLYFWREVYGSIGAGRLRLIPWELWKRRRYIHHTRFSRTVTCCGEEDPWPPWPCHGTLCPCE
jgi:RHS repeat-associated protein